MCGNKAKKKGKKHEKRANKQRIARPGKFYDVFPNSRGNKFRVTDVLPGANRDTVGKLCSARGFRLEHIIFFFSPSARKSRFRPDFARFSIVLLGRVWGPLVFVDTGFKQISPRRSQQPNQFLDSPVTYREKGHKRSSRQRPVYSSFLRSNGMIDREKLLGFGRIGSAPGTVFFFLNVIY